MSFKQNDLFFYIFNHLSIHSFLSLFIHSSVYSLFYFCIFYCFVFFCLFIHLFVYSFISQFIYLVIYFFIHFFFFSFVSLFFIYLFLYSSIHSFLSLYLFFQVAREAGFGNRCPTNNIPESINALLKRWQGFQAKDISAFVDDLKDLVDRQKMDVRRAFIGTDSPYVVREEYRDSIDRSFFQKNPGNRTWPTKKPLVQPSRYNEVLKYKCKPASSATSASSARVHQPQIGGPDIDIVETLCHESLAGLFTKNDLKSLTAKAKQLVKDNTVREGFEPNTYFIKSSSKPAPHIVKSSSNGKFLCDSDCLGYKARKICSHVIAVAFAQNKLPQFLAQFTTSGSSTVNLTNLTCNNVNKDAGRKRPRSRKGRSKSPDTMTTMKQSRTLGELFNENDETSSDDEYSAVAGTPSKLLRVTLRRKRPAKPQVSPTTSTPYQLIDITGRIRKCAGCGGLLKDGPDPFSRHQLDEKMCIRHKEHDFVWLERSSQWKKTFDNKHYHIFSNCVRSRNGDTFNVSSVDIALNHTIVEAEMSFLKTRFSS